MKLRLLTAAIAVIVPASAFAVTINVVTSPGTTYTTAAITTDNTSNSTMLGSIVTASFSNGTTSTAVWTAAGATGTGFSLTESGDTFDFAWTLTNTSQTLGITGFSMNGAPGNTSFDIVINADDTPGSGAGKPFEDLTGQLTGTVTALYTNELKVGGVFYGDEYTEEQISFSNALAAGKEISYYNDTDNATSSSPIVVASPTPEPSSLVLLGTGILGLGGMVRRRFGK